MVEETNKGTTRNIGMPWIPQSLERSSGAGDACQTRDLVLNSENDDL